MKIASFDIGRKNFAFCIEDTEGSQATSSDVWLEGTLQHLESSELTSDVYTFDKLLCYLEQRKHLWEIIDIFLIEQQMLINTKASKIANQLEAYFKTCYPLKKTLFFSSKHKTKAFEAESMTYTQRKKFTISLVMTKLSLRKDEQSLKYICALPKMDDVCDAICQLQAYKIRGPPK